MEITVGLFFLYLEKQKNIYKNGTKSALLLQATGLFWLGIVSVVMSFSALLACIIIFSFLWSMLFFQARKIFSSLEKHHVNGSGIRDRGYTRNVKVWRNYMWGTEGGE